MNLDTAQLPPLPLWGLFYIVDGCQPKHAGISCGTTGKAQAPCSACSGRPACMNLDTAQLPPLPLWGSFYIVDGCQPEHAGISCGTTGIAQASCSACSGRPACINLDTAQLPPLPLWGSLYVVPNRKTQKNRLRALLNSIFFRACGAAPGALRAVFPFQGARAPGPQRGRAGAHTPLVLGLWSFIILHIYIYIFARYGRTSLRPGGEYVVILVGPPGPPGPQAVFLFLFPPAPPPGLKRQAPHLPRTQSRSARPATR